MRSWVRTVTEKTLAWATVVIFGGVVIVAIVLGMIKIEKPELASVNVWLNRVTLEEINAGSKDEKYEGNTVIIKDGERETEYVGVQIKGRGNYSWTQPKRSYRLKFPNKVELMGLGEGKKWVVIASYMDDAFVRNDLAQFIARMVGQRYAAIGDFVSFAVDSEELGAYYLTWPLEVGVGRVELHDKLGVLVELDNNYCEYEEEWFETVMGNCLVMKDAVSEVDAEVAMREFVEKFDELELAVEAGNYERVEMLADVRSLAEYFVVSEFAANPDAYVSSYFFYKDGLDDKIHAGPVWDFDGAFGNKKWMDGQLEEEFYNPWSNRSRYEEAFSGDYYNEEGILIHRKANASASKMLSKLVLVPEFMEVVCDVYREGLRGHEREVLGRIDEDAKKIRDAAVIDVEIWGKNDFDEAVEYLKWWIEERFRFFDTKFGDRKAHV